MRDEKKLQIRRRFLEVADLPEAEPRAALTRHGGGDARLRAEIEALPRADAEIDSFLASPTGKCSSTSERSAAPASETAGTPIGRYEQLEQLGAGGRDTKQVLARFEDERQALAQETAPGGGKR